MIVLDTNVLSELMRPHPTPLVVSWVSARPATSLFTTAITQAELLYGVALLPAGRRRTAIERAVEQMFAEDFEGRVLAFDAAAAREYASISARRRHSGRPIAHLDAQIAAIACSRGASVATRNIGDFEDCGTNILDPWNG